MYTNYTYYTYPQLQEGLKPGPLGVLKIGSKVVISNGLDPKYLEHFRPYRHLYIDIPYPKKLNEPTNWLLVCFVNRFLENDEHVFCFLAKGFFIYLMKLVSYFRSQVSVAFTSHHIRPAFGAFLSHQHFFIYV